MVRKRSRRRSRRVEEDPMAGTSNLVDAMLVIAVGFLVFVIINACYCCWIFGFCYHKLEHASNDRSITISAGKNATTATNNRSKSGSGVK